MGSPTFRNILLTILFLPYASTILCINSTSYMDRMLVKPMASQCKMDTALCVKTMQISQNSDGSPNVLSIHRECYELQPPRGNTKGGHGCVDSYDEDDPISRRIGKRLMIVGTSQRCYNRRKMRECPCSPPGEANFRATLDYLLLFVGFMQLLTILLIVLGPSSLSSLKILIYSPRMIPSHVAFVANIANLLAGRGHQVTVIDSVLRTDLNHNLDEKVVKVQVSTSPTISNSLKNLSLPQEFWRLRIEPDQQKNVMEHLGKLFLDQCTHLYENYQHELQELENFDLGMHEVFDVCGIGIFEALKIRKTVILSSTGMRDIVSEALGIEDPLYTSSILSDYGSYVPFLGIRRNLQFHSAWRHFFETQSKPLEKLMGVDQSFEKLLRYSNLMFLNTHELADCHRKWSRRVHEIGGISFKEPKELDQEYNQLLLSGNSKFVVLVSFGTTTPSFLMPIEYKMSLMNVFSKLDHILFIWKYEKDDEFSKRVVPNVVFKKYIPQVDLLESGRISLFITHGGQNSLLETFHAGVPALVVPLFGDQHRNAQIAKEKHLATVLRKEDMANEEVVEQAIRNGIGGDEGLVSNLSELSSALRDAKSVAENLLMTTIETTYSSSHFPPNFLQSPPCSLNSNDYLLILDVAFHTLIFVIMMFLVNIIRN